jgi:hypothetical protein
MVGRENPFRCRGGCQSSQSDSSPRFPGRSSCLPVCWCGSFRVERVQNRLITMRVNTAAIVVSTTAAMIHSRLIMTFRGDLGQWPCGRNPVRSVLRETGNSKRPAVAHPPLCASAFKPLPRSPGREAEPARGSTPTCSPERKSRARLYQYAAASTSPRTVLPNRACLRNDGS